MDWAATLRQRWRRWSMLIRARLDRDFERKLGPFARRAANAYLAIHEFYQLA